MLEATPVKEGPEREYFCVIKNVSICSVKEFIQLNLPKEEIERKRKILWCLGRKNSIEQRLGHFYYADSLEEIYTGIFKKALNLNGENPTEKELIGGFYQGDNLVDICARVLKRNPKMARYLIVVENASVHPIEEIIQLNLSKEEMEKKRDMLCCIPFPICLDGKNSVWGELDHFFHPDNFANLKVRVSKMDLKVGYVAIFENASIYVRGKGGELNRWEVEIFFIIHLFLLFLLVK
jgi:hypothetical protein